MQIKTALLSVVVLAAVCATAQEPQFTQFYASPMYLNPAFTGLTYEHRFTAGYRRQWPGLQRGFTTFMAGYDYNLADLNSGIGAMVLQDRAGLANLVTTTGGLNYAYRFKIKRGAEIRAGMMAALTQKRVDNSKLVFNDQLITGSPLSSDLRADPLTYLDMGAGALLNTDTYWFGLSAKHINQPNGSLVGNVEPLPVYLSLHGGYRYVISESGGTRSKLEEFISASFNVRKMQQNDQLDVGAYYFKSFMNVGVWYRGLPLKRYKPGYPNRESLCLLLGLEIPDKMFRIGYSYDITVSSLGVGTTQGAHEVALIYEIAKKKMRNRRVLVSCPKF
jgi:type IX secretion system PorP/SprF family membrane protein